MTDKPVNRAMGHGVRQYCVVTMTADVPPEIASQSQRVRPSACLCVRATMTRAPTSSTSTVTTRINAAS